MARRVIKRRMCNWSRSFLASVLTLMGFSSLCAEPLSGPEIAEKVRLRFLSATNLYIKYVQTIRGASLQGAEKVSGKIWLKGEQIFRIETPLQSIVTDGKTLWNYTRQLRQVTIQNLKKARNLTLPKDFLYSFFNDYSATLVGSEKIASTYCFHLRLISNRKDVLIPALDVWVNAKTFFTRRVIYTEATENCITFDFPLIRMNIAIADSHFSFTPPGDAEVITLP